MDWKIAKEPIWIYEAALAMGRYYHDDMDNIIDKRIESGQDRESIEGIFKNYKKYKLAVMKEIEPYIPEEPFIRQCLNTGEVNENLITKFAYHLYFNGERDVEDEKFEAYMLQLVEACFQGWMGIQDDDKKAESFDDFFEVMTKSGLDLTRQMQLVTVFHRRKQFYQILVSSLEHIVDILKKYEYLIHDDLEELNESLEVADIREKLFDHRYGIELHERTLNVYITIFGYNIIQYEIDDKKEAEMVTILGIYTFKLIETKRNQNRNDIYMTETFKALSDHNRVRILHMLKERPMYTQEIAQKLKLTPATVSHHMNVLLQKELIGVKVLKDEKKSRLVRYMLRDDSFHRLSDYLLKFTEKSKEGSF